MTTVEVDIPVPLLLLEHINLNVPELDAITAKRFFEALGATHNPVGSNERQVHVNVGLSQVCVRNHCTIVCCSLYEHALAM